MGSITAKLVVLFVIFIGALAMLEGISLDTFNDLWQRAFVIGVTATLFASIPFGIGFLVRLFAWQD